MVQIHNTGFCPADWAEIKNLFGRAEYYPESALLDSLGNSNRVMLNSPSGYAIIDRSSLQDLTAITDGAQELFANVANLVGKASKNIFELQFLAVADTTIPELQKIILDVFKLLAPNTAKPLEPLAADLAQLTKGVMYADHATHADLYINFSCEAQSQVDQRQFGYDGYMRRDVKDGTAHHITYLGERGTMAKLVPDHKTAWELFEIYHGRGPNSTGEVDFAKRLQTFSKVVENLSIAWANRGDIFSYVRAGSCTPPGLISALRSGPFMSVRIDPSNNGWLNHGLHKGAELHSFSRGRLEEILGHSIQV